jgi:hypothetical protein
MRRNTRVDRLLQGFLDVAARPACRQDCSPYRYGPASRAAPIGERAARTAAPGNVVPDVVWLGADDQVPPVFT